MPSKMTSTIDLDINNYELEDLLSLFQIHDNRLTRESMTAAKKITLKMHPDKSGLDKSYFLFFSQAYKLLYEIYRFQNKHTDTDYHNTEYHNTEYHNTSYISEEMSSDNRVIIDRLMTKFERGSHREFNKWFNQEFEKIKIEKEEDAGYDEWFKNGDSESDKKSGNKPRTRDSITSYYSSTDAIGSSILGNKPDDYSSDIFTSLKYEDLKMAHTIDDSISVSAQNYREKDVNAGIESLKSERSIEIQPQSIGDATRQLSIEERNQNAQDIGLAYRLARQQEIIAAKNKDWWSSLRLIK